MSSDLPCAVTTIAFTKRSTMPNLKHIKTSIPTLVDLTLCIAGAVCTICGLVYLVLGEIGLATTGLGSGLVLLFAATMERFETLKGLGLEAKTRELSAKIGEADNAVREVKQLAEICGHTLSMLASRVGRFGGAFTFAEGHNLASQVKENLKSLGCDDASIRTALEPWVQITLGDLARRITQDVHDLIQIEQQKLYSVINSNASPVHPLDPEHVAIRERLAVINEHMLSGNKIPSADMDTIMDKLENHVRTAPEISDECKSAFLQTLNTWKPEVKHLIKFGDVIDPQHWSENLKF